MKRPVVIFDIDGVLADFIYGFTTLANWMFGSPIIPTHEQENWDVFPRLDKRQINEVWRGIRCSRTFWQNLSRLGGDGLFTTIDAIADECDIYFVTGRVGITARQQTIDWLEAFGVRSPQVIMSTHKGDVARAIGATHLIDDKAGNVVYTAYAAPDCQPYVLDRPYNQFPHDVIGTRIKRVYQVETFIDDIMKEGR